MALRQARQRVVLSLTPLIDVVFILLVFFMLASEFSDWRKISLTSQATLQTTRVPSDQQPVILLLRNDGAIELDGGVVATVDTVLSDLSGRSVAGGVLVKAADEVAFQVVVDLVEALARVGLNNVRLADVAGVS